MNNKLVLSHQLLYTGFVIKGFFDGLGKLECSHKSTYYGDFKNGQFNGKGQLVPFNGTQLTGLFSKGLFTGQGEMVCSDGTKYVGHFTSDTIEGLGCQIVPQSKDQYSEQNAHPFSSKYAGEFTEGLFHRQGELTFDDGTKYSGKFRNGVPHGIGVLVYPDGSWYEGNFKKGKQVFVIQNKGFDDYKRLDGADYCVYKGKFEKGLRHGEAMLTWSNRDVQVGTWEKDKKHGSFELTKADGTVWNLSYVSGELIEINKRT
eukprot:CAMPEP_0168322360 /NCGR_PEP_ID=MMETSP0213-20121227/2843_1 /TAXON_ID=151035 /ORGANISM="Euplotes harpa, Strain FSP1.4" /LENGTH=258 /DNA_ID=CAMNT_0008324233 /DNA_START=1329 /DNA_END=2105 /DNA_ORIENTATION=+